jgi:hypothetical protein
MRQCRWMMLASLLAISVISFAQDLDYVTETYIRTFFDTFKSEYLYSSKMDWGKLQAQALETARKAPKDEAAHVAIAAVLETINDPAISFDLWPIPSNIQRLTQVGELGIRADQSTRLIYEVFGGSPAEKSGVRVGDELVSINGKAPRIQGEHVYSDDKIVPLSIKRGDQDLEINVPLFALDGVIAPMHAGRLGRAAYLEPARGYLDDERQRNQMAISLQSRMRSLETDGVCGYVLDFRRVRSNTVPMISGLGPVLTLTNAPVFQVVHPNGEQLAIRYEPSTGMSSWGLSSDYPLNAKPWKSQRPQAPIAVLTGPFNADLLPVAFAGRTNSRFFGESKNLPPIDAHSVGFSDSAYVSFPAGVILNRLGHKYDAPLEVDETIPTDWTVFGTKNDAVIQAAQAWLESQPACQ